MHQPDDPDGQQIIREIRYENGNGLFGKFQQAILIAAALAVGGGLWTMNTRLSKVETLLEVVVANQAVKIK